ncbi:MAG: PDZ domain-containing protein [bacterium]
MIRNTVSRRCSGTALFSVLMIGLVLTAGDHLLAKSKKGWLGVSVQEMTPTLREEMKMGNRPGLLIADVAEDSPAEEAGLHEEDVILSFDGHEVEKIADFTRMVRKTAPGTQVKVKYLRDGQEQETEVTVGKRRRHRRNVFALGGDRSLFFVSDRPQLGVEIQELNGDLAGYFKVEEHGGVLILKVLEDSPAEQAGLKAGDVITKLDGEEVSNPDELIDLLKEYDEGDEVRVDFVRKGQAKQAKVQLEYIENSGGRKFRALPPGLRMHGFELRDWDGSRDIRIFGKNHLRRFI